MHQPSAISQSDLYLTAVPVSLDQQREQGFVPRADCAPWSLSLPLDWGADPFGDSNWCMTLHAWKMMNPILSEYFRTREPNLMAEAFSFAHDWHRYHCTDGKAARFSWDDMASGIRALRLAFFLEAEQRGTLQLNQPQKTALMSMAKEHVRRLSEESFISLNNHGLLQVAGLNLLGVVMNLPTACQLACSKFKQLLDMQFTEEGVHTENSPGYHFYVNGLISQLGALRRMPLALAIDRISSVKPWLVFPNGELAAIGDTLGRSLPLSVPPDRVEVVRGRPYAVGDFTRSGYAILRSVPPAGDSMLFVTGMARRSAHKHADELSFELFERGRRILVDSGKYGFKRDAMRSYVRSAAAHNTISLVSRVVGPESIELNDTSLLAPVRVDDDAFVIEGTVVRPGFFRQTRTMRYRPGRSLWIHDMVVSETEEACVSSLHLAPDLKPQLDGNGFTVDAGEFAIRAEVEASAGCELSTARGQEEPLLGWQCAGYLNMVPASVVMAKSKLGRRQDITWKIAID